MGYNDREINSITRSWSDINCIELIKAIFYSTIFYTLFFNPINVILTHKRLNVTGKNISTINYFRHITKMYGYKRLYRGFGISCVGTFCTESAFIPILEYYREKGIHNRLESQILKDYFAGAFSYLLVLPICTPFSLIANKQMAAGIEGAHKYQNSFLMTKTIIKNDGIKGLFKGIGILAMCVPIHSSWWSLYGCNKYIMYSTYQYYNKNDSNNIFISSKDNVMINGLAGGTSGLIMTLMLNPIEFLATNVQSLNTNKNIKYIPLIKNIYQMSGIKGFYKGLSLNLINKFIECSIYGITYDGVKQYSTQEIELSIQKLT